MRIVEKEVTTSTMDDCRALVQPGEPIAVIAAAQRSGVGRRGNVWSSPPGGLYVTFGWSVEAPLRAWSGLSLAVGVSIMESLSLASFGFGLKWPNDIVHAPSRRKLCGVLIQLFDGAQHTTVLVGLGMNCAQIDLPEAISLEEIVGIAWKPRDVLDRITDGLDATIKEFSQLGFTPYRERWMEFSVHNGSSLALQQEKEIIKGGFEGVAEDGALILKTDGGRARFQSGHVLEW